jgi:hypothetical protein
MEEEAINYLFDYAVSQGYKKSREDFIKLIQTNDEAFGYAFDYAKKGGYKKDEKDFGILIGRGTTTPVTTTEPAKTETVTEPAKELRSEPMATVKAQALPEKQVATPTMEVKSVEATPTKEEPMTAEKKEVVKSDIESQLLPVTEKTEVKAIETPSDKMVIKSDQPKVEVKPTEVAKVEVNPTEVAKGVPSYGNIDKNTDIGGGVFTDKTKISSNLDAKELSPKEILDEELLTKGWYKIELNRNVSSRYPDPPNVDAKKTIESENVGVFKPIKIGEENYYTNYDKDSKKWYLYKEGSSDNEWKELKNGAIKSMLNSKLLNNNGEPIKEQIDYTEKDANEIELAKKKLAYNKYLQYLVNNFDGLTEKEQQQVRDIMQQSDSDKYYRWISQNVDDPKVIDFWIKALEKTNTDSYYLEEIKKKKNNLIPTEEPKVEVKEVPAPSEKMVIKSEAKVEPKPTEVAKVEVKEMKAEEPKMKVKGKLKPEPIKIETIKVESEKGPTTVEVPNFAVPEPRKKYKPYGEKGPDVYYSEEYDQYIIKEGDNRTVVNKGSGKYEELTNKISESVGSTKEGKGKCDTPPFVGCSKEQTALTNFKYYKGDNYAMGSGRTDEGGLIETLDYRKNRLEKYGESVWSLYGEGDDPDRKTEGDIYYANQEPPKSDRFITYKPFGNDKTLIYDKESGIILKQLNQKAPMVDLSVTGQVVDEKGNVVKKGSDPREYWQKYAKENPNEGLTVWQGYELDHPEYKELKSIIEGINYKKEKGAKNTYVAPPTETQFVPDWLKQ